MTPHRMRRALPAVTMLAAGALTLGGCGVIARPAPSATALPSGITATLLPASPAEQENQVRLWVSNGTDDDLSVTRVRITDPRFLGYGRASRYGTVQIEAGMQAEIVMTLPRIDCDDESPTTTEPSVAATDAATASPSPTATATAPSTVLILGFTVGAATGTTSETLKDPDGVIDAYIAAACP